MPRQPSPARGARPPGVRQSRACASPHGRSARGPRLIPGIGQHQPCGFLQATAGSVAGNRVADLLGHGKAEPRHALVLAAARPAVRRPASPPSAPSRQHEGTRHGASGGRAQPNAGPRSGRKALAPLGPPVGQHLAASDCRHAGAESVPPLADQLRRLIGTLHGRFSDGASPPARQAGRGATRGALAQAAAYRGAGHTSSIAADHSCRWVSIPIAHLADADPQDQPHELNCRSRDSIVMRQRGKTLYMIDYAVSASILASFVLLAVLAIAWIVGASEHTQLGNVCAPPGRAHGWVGSHPILAPLSLPLLYAAAVCLSLPESARTHRWRRPPVRDAVGRVVGHRRLIRRCNRPVPRGPLPSRRCNRRPPRPLPGRDPGQPASGWLQLPARHPPGTSIPVLVGQPRRRIERHAPVALWGRDRASALFRPLSSSPRSATASAKRWQPETSPISPSFSRRASSAR